VIIPNFIKTYPTVLEVKQADDQTLPHFFTLFLCTSYKTHA